MATVASLEAKRRRHIVDSTMRVLVREGVAGTSLSRVAREARVAKGIICYYFKSKDQLYDAVLTGVQERTFAAAMVDAEGFDQAWHRIAAFIRAHLKPLEDRRMEILSLRHLASTNAGGSSASDHLAVWRNQQQWLADELLDGQLSGDFKTFDPQAVSNAICAAIESALLHWAHDPSVDLEHRTEQLLSLFEPGVRGGARSLEPRESPSRADQASFQP